MYVRIYLICINFFVQIFIPFVTLVILNFKTYQTIKDSEKKLVKNFQVCKWIAKFEVLQTSKYFLISFFQLSFIRGIDSMNSNLVLVYNQQRNISFIKIKCRGVFRGNIYLSLRINRSDISLGLLSLPLIKWNKKGSIKNSFTRLQFCIFWAIYINIKKNWFCK